MGLSIKSQAHILIAIFCLVSGCTFSKKTEDSNQSTPDPKIVSASISTQIFNAIENADAVALQNALFKATPAEIHSRNGSGQTPIELAILHGRS